MEQNTQCFHCVLKVSDLVVLHTGGNAHAVGKVYLITALAYHEGYPA